MLTTDNGKTMSIQANGTSGGHILYPGSGGGVSSATLASGNYELVVLRFDGGNFRITEATPATAAAIGMAGSTPDINRWNFPTAANYAAGQSDNGNALSSYNTAAGLTVTLPSTAAIGSRLDHGVCDRQRQTAERAGQRGFGRFDSGTGAGREFGHSIALAAGQNYEFLQLRFDGSNFRIISATRRPSTISAD